MAFIHCHSERVEVKRPNIANVRFPTVFKIEVHFVSALPVWPSCVFLVFHQTRQCGRPHISICWIILFAFFDNAGWSGDDGATVSFHSVAGPRRTDVPDVGSCVSQKVSFVWWYFSRSSDRSLQCWRRSNGNVHCTWLLIGPGEEWREGERMGMREAHEDTAS